jgi:hypothetical protein
VMPSGTKAAALLRREKAASDDDWADGCGPDCAGAKLDENRVADQ